MIKIIIGIVLAFALTWGTVFVSDETVEGYACGPACDAIVDLETKGFPFAFMNDEPIEFSELSEGLSSDLVESRFDVVAFGMSFLFWFGVVSALYAVTKIVLTRFGMLAAVGLGGLYLAGYLGIVVGL